MPEDSPYRHPYPCKYYPLFRSQHEAAKFIEQYQANDHIKKCAHLTIATYGGGYSGESLQFRPECLKEPFHFEEENEFRRNPMRSFLGCPNDCHFYESAGKKKAKGWLKKHWRSFRQSIVGIANWYASLSPATQVIIALGVLALIGVSWQGTILEIVKMVLKK